VQFPASEFRVVGYGEGEATINSLTTECPNIKMYRRAYSQMQQEHEEAHIGVVPSLWSEGTSLSCIEAMAAGCAVVCSDVGGLGNLVFPGFNGFLLPPNPEAFTRTVAELLSTPNMAGTMGLRGQQIAKSSFSLDTWEARVMEVTMDVQQTPFPGKPPRRFKPA
jgi:glycosyltransferase involved in cell wall biosynthesis